jgi:hypothetical protein
MANETTNGNGSKKLGGLHYRERSPKVTATVAQSR